MNTEHLHICAECRKLEWHASSFHTMCLKCHAIERAFLGKPEYEDTQTLQEWKDEMNRTMPR